MSGWEMDTNLAMGIHGLASGDAAKLPAARTAIRNAVSGAASAAYEEDIPAALHGFWNDDAAPQAQAAESKIANALTALDSMVANYLAADYASAAVASQAADAIPRNVTHIDDRFT